MIATQVKFNNHTSYNYDSDYDTLRVTFNYSQEFYYDEPYPNLLIRYNEENDKIVGVQIIDVKQFNLNVMLNYLNQPILQDTLEIIKDILC